MTDPGAASPLSPGDVVAGKYRVDRVLGVGGMGVVLAATHEHLDQRVALKFLLPAVAAQPDLVRRFLREARAAVKIESEHVARVLDVGTHDGAPYMVMEYLEGQDLAQLLAARGALPVAEAVGYLLEACEAVALAHSQGIVHRDLKPANLFLATRATGKPVVKVLDFGISKAPPSAKDGNVTQAAAVMGSPSYMSPEQVLSAASVDPRSDVWALGVVLYEMISGGLPFPADTMPELMGQILQKPYVPLDLSRPDVPREVRAVLDRCLQKEPEKRYASVAELARALVPFGPPRSELLAERIEHVLGVSRAASPAPPPAPAPAATGSQTFSPATSAASTQGGRARQLSWPLGLLAAGVAAAAIVFALRASRPAPAPAPALAQSTPAAPVSVQLPEAPPAPPVVAPASAAAASAAVAPAPDGGPTAPRAAAATPTRPVPAAARPPGPPPAGTATCHTVTRFDADGNKHFSQECP